MTARDDIAKWLRTQIRVGKIGPNSAAIIERGGTVCLTPQEAEDAADALLASPAHARLLNEARAEGWDECSQLATKTLGFPSANPYRKDT